MKKVAIATSGGTIAMTKSHEGVVPFASGSSMIPQIPGLSSIADVKLIEFFNVSSPHMTLKMMWDLSRLVQNLADRKNVRGNVPSTRYR